MKRINLILSVLSLFFFISSSIEAQRLAVKTNVLSLLTTTVNAGVEYKVNHKLTTEFDIMYNPWNVLPDNKKMTGLVMQTGMKYWLCQVFYRHSVGIHLHYGQYNGGFKTYRYQGDLFGAGLLTLTNG